MFSESPVDRLDMFKDGGFGLVGDGKFGEIGVGWEEGFFALF